MGSVVPPFVGRRSINTFGRKLSMFNVGSGLTPRLSNQKITFKKPPETRNMFRLTRLCGKRKHNYRQSGQVRKSNYASPYETGRTGKTTKEKSLIEGAFVQPFPATQARPGRVPGVAGR